MTRVMQVSPCEMLQLCVPSSLRPAAIPPLLAIFGGDALADWGNLTARNRRLARLGRVG
jgi:hypothetical protein